MSACFFPLKTMRNSGKIALLLSFTHPEVPTSPWLLFGKEMWFCGDIEVSEHFYVMHAMHNVSNWLRWTQIQSFIAWWHFIALPYSKSKVCNFSKEKISWVLHVLAVCFAFCNWNNACVKFLSNCLKPN